MRGFFHYETLPLTRASLFSGEIIKVLVGPKRTPFSVHHRILQRVPMLARALSLGSPQGSHSRTILLPDEDPYIMDVVFRSLYNPHMISRCDLNNRTIAETILQLYAIADKLEHAQLKQRIELHVDQWLSSKSVTPEEVISCYSIVPRGLRLRQMYITHASRLFHFLSSSTVQASLLVSWKMLDMNYSPHAGEIALDLLKAILP